MIKHLNNIFISGFLILLPFTGSYSFIPSNDIVIDIKEIEAVEKSNEAVNIEPVDTKQSIKYKNAEIIKDIAKSNEIAPIDMLAMWHTESLTGDALIGDSGCSLGHFHINICSYANPSAKSIIGDIKTEAEWVADRLHKFNYSENRVMAIAKYNLPAGGNMKYYERVEDRKQYIKKYLD